MDLFALVTTGLVAQDAPVRSLCSSVGILAR